MTNLEKILNACKILVVPTIAVLTDLKKHRSNSEDDRERIGEEKAKEFVLSRTRLFDDRRFGEVFDTNFRKICQLFDNDLGFSAWTRLLERQKNFHYAAGVPYGLHASQEVHFWKWVSSWILYSSATENVREKDGFFKTGDSNDSKCTQQRCSARKRRLNEPNYEEEDVVRIRKRKLQADDSSRKSQNLTRLTKNECICIPVGEKPDYSQDLDAKITVEEWRLHSVQSPIELKHDETNEYNDFEPLEFHGHWDEDGEATFTNNGYTATLSFQNRDVPILMGGPLHEDKYIFEQLHFHWTEDDHDGCEHIFEGKAYSMEAHAVHYNSKYDTFGDAVDKHDGLAVVAFFLQATDDFENPCFKKLSEAVKDIAKINASTNVRSDCLTWIKDAAQCKGYYTYQGSLTTEPYFESVTWIIYPKPIHISREQVQNFRDMKSTPCEKHNIINNVRPIQTPQKKLEVFFARSHKSSE